MKLKLFLDCQWIDITDVPHGHYILRLHANPGNQVAETDFYNNIGMCRTKIKTLYKF